MEQVAITSLTRELADQKKDDLVAIDQALRAKFGSVYSQEAWCREHFLHDLPEKWSLSFIALHHDKTVGFSICSLVSKNEMTYLHRIGISPLNQRQGIGKKLLDSTIGASKKINASVLILEENISNSNAFSFYASLGFKVLYGDEIKECLIKRNKLQRCKLYNDHFVESGFEDEHKRIMLLDIKSYYAIT